jgi:hypothetical protein
MQQIGVSRSPQPIVVLVIVAETLVSATIPGLARGGPLRVQNPSQNFCDSPCVLRWILRH